MDPIDKEDTNQYLRRLDNGLVDLEPQTSYLQRAKVAMNMSKTRAANWVAIILVVGLVLSLPLSVFAMLKVDAEQAKLIESVFDRWYDVVAPVLGAVVGALFGISIAGRQKGDSD